VHTTRKPHPGRHIVDVIVNGRSIPLGTFEVLPAKRRRATAGSVPRISRKPRPYESNDGS
jgi:hypothetical protein